MDQLRNDRLHLSSLELFYGSCPNQFKMVWKRARVERKTVIKHWRLEQVRDPETGRGEETGVLTGHMTRHASDTCRCVRGFLPAQQNKKVRGVIKK